MDDVEAFKKQIDTLSEELTWTRQCLTEAHKRVLELEARLESREYVVGQLHELVSQLR